MPVSSRSGRPACIVSVLRNVAIDCADAYELARFWVRVTGRPLHPEAGPGDREVRVSLAEGPVSSPEYRSAGPPGITYPECPPIRMRTLAMMIRL